MNGLRAVLGFVLLATPVPAADRLTDRDVKALVSRIEDGRDRFDDAMDGQLKRSIVRGPRQIPASSSVWSALAPRMQMLADAYGRTEGAGAR